MIPLHPFDYAAIAGYFLLVVLIAARVTRAKPDSDDLFLAGRSFGPLAVGFSLFSANISSDTLIGLPGAAYLGGISVANYEWMAGVVLIFTVFFVMPVLMRARVATMPELMERRFDPRMRKYLSAVTLFLSIILDTAATMYAGALVITTFFPVLGLTETCWGIAIFTGLYTASGGLRAVVYTEVLQAVILLTGSAVLATVVFGKFDYSWAAVVEAARPGDLSLVRPLSDPTLPWLGLVTGVPIAGFYYWTMNQYVVQRVLASRDIEAAARGALFAALLKLLPLFLMVMPGVMAVSLLPPLEHADEVFPTLVAQFVPVGVRGILIAGLMAALMSTVSATLNSSSTLITLDFVQPRRPDLSSEQLARIGRVLTLAITALAAAWAPMILHFKGLWAYLQQVFAFVASPLVATFLLGLWVRPLGASAALRGLACGHLLSAALFVARQAGWVTIHFTVIGGVLFVATGVMTLLWMRILRDRDRASGSSITLLDRERLTFASRKTRAAAAGVLALIACLVYAFH